MGSEKKLATILSMLASALKFEVDNLIDQKAGLEVGFVVLFSQVCLNLNFELSCGVCTYSLVIGAFFPVVQQIFVNLVEFFLPELRKTEVLHP